MKQQISATKKVLASFCICLIAGLAVVATSLQSPVKAEEAEWSPFFQRNTMIVADIDRSIALYRDVLNFTPNSVLTIEDYPALSSIYDFFDLDESAEIRFTSFNAGEEQVRALALVEVAGMDLPAADRPRMSGAVIRVGDHESVLEKAKALNLTIVEPKYVNDPGFAYVEAGFVDYDGHLIIIIQSLPSK